LEYFKLYSNYKDSLLNLETNESLNKLNTLYETEKKEKAILELNKEKEKQDAISKEEVKKRNLVILFISIGLIFLLVFAFFIYKSYKRKIIDNKEITKQNDIIKHKNQEITDSINYALRIQNSFLASESTFSDNLKDYFILFKPKDIVSGDFYWAEQINEKFYVCVADSTGHGIPGAFMSLLNISLLNEALLSKNFSSTSEILNFVRRILIQGLKTDLSGQGGNDGMDCSLISINLKTMQLEFTGANNPIWIVRNKEVIELDANKMPVGRSPKQDVPFSSQIFALQPNDFIYLFTDGLPDQFGGPKGKKYKYKQLQSRVLTISDFSLKEQRKIIEDSFNQWKGNLEQVDDVLMIGIKI